MFLNKPVQVPCPQSPAGLEDPEEPSVNEKVNHTGQWMPKDTHNAPVHSTYTCIYLTRVYTFLNRMTVIQEQNNEREIFNYSTGEFYIQAHTAAIY